MKYGKRTGTDHTPEMVIAALLIVALLIGTFLVLTPPTAGAAGRPGARPTATTPQPIIVTLSEVEVLYEGTYRAKVDGVKRLLTVRVRTAPPLKNGRCDISQYQVS